MIQIMHVTAEHIIQSLDSSCWTAHELVHSARLDGEALAREFMNSFVDVVFTYIIVHIGLTLRVPIACCLLLSCMALKPIN